MNNAVNAVNPKIAFIMSHGTANANLTVTKRRRPTKDASIPFVTPEKYLDAFNLSKTGAVTVSNRKEGANMAMVATREPTKPYNRYPTKVAVITIGPGVTCPRAIPSMNVLLSIQPLTSTISWSINGHRREPAAEGKQVDSEHQYSQTEKFLVRKIEPDNSAEQYHA